MGTKAVGVNVNYEIDAKGKLKIEVDLKKENGLSKSGKTIVIGSSQGNARIYDEKGNEFVFGLNVYKYPKGD